jgi:hypothetical protein
MPFWFVRAAVPVTARSIKAPELTLEEDIDKARPVLKELATKDKAEEVVVPEVTPEVIWTEPVEAGAMVMLPEVVVWRARAAEVVPMVNPAVADRVVPTPVRLLEFKAKAEEEKLYSSVPLTWMLVVLPVKALMLMSPVLSEKMATTEPAGAPVVVRNSRLERSWRSKPSASMSEVQGVIAPPQALIDKVPEPLLCKQPEASAAGRVHVYEEVTLLFA